MVLSKQGELGRRQSKQIAVSGFQGITSRQVPLLETIFFVLLYSDDGLIAATKSAGCNQVIVALKEYWSVRVRGRDCAAS
jgi:hypothetical protein